MQTALLLTAALASEDEPPGGLAQRHVSGGPASIPGLGGQGHGTQSHRPQGGRAETRLLAQPSPAAVPASMSGILQLPGLHSQMGPRPASPLGWAWQAGSWAGWRGAAGSSSWAVEPSCPG